MEARGIIGSVLSSRFQIKQSRLQPWLGTNMCSVPGQDTLHPGVQMGTSKFNAGGNPLIDYHPIQGGVQILLASLFMLQKLEISVGLMGHWAGM